MANSLYNEQMQNSFNSQLSSFMSNPMGFLIKRNIDIPQEYYNNPYGAIQYLLNSGKMTQGQLNSYMQRAQQMGFKF